MQTGPYIFQITPYDTEILLPQVSKALEKRTELVSRQQCPGLWKQTDRFQAMAKGKTRSRLRTRVMSVVCLALGIFLLVPGLMDPQELLVPLIVGVVAVGAGIGGLWTSRKHRHNPFDKSAAILLNDLNGQLTGKICTMAFTDQGMTASAAGDFSETVPWQDISCAVETEDAFLLVHRDRAALLQKKDLSGGGAEAFRALLASSAGAFSTV